MDANMHRRQLAGGGGEGKIHQRCFRGIWSRVPGVRQMRKADGWALRSDLASIDFTSF